MRSNNVCTYSYRPSPVASWRSQGRTVSLEEGRREKLKRRSGFVARRIGGHGGGCIDCHHSKLCAEVGPAIVLGRSAFLRERLELLLAHGAIHRGQHQAKNVCSDDGGCCSGSHRVPHLGLQRCHLPGAANFSWKLRRENIPGKYLFVRLCFPSWNVKGSYTSKDFQSQ